VCTLSNDIMYIQVCECECIEHVKLGEFNTGDALDGHLPLSVSYNATVDGILHHMRGHVHTNFHYGNWSSTKVVNIDI